MRLNMIFLTIMMTFAGQFSAAEELTPLESQFLDCRLSQLEDAIEEDNCELEIRSIVSRTSMDRSCKMSFINNFDDTGDINDLQRAIEVVESVEARLSEKASLRLSQLITECGCKGEVEVDFVKPSGSQSIRCTR